MIVAILLKFRAVIVAFLFGMMIASGAAFKWASIQEAGRLTRALEIKEQERAAALMSMQTYYLALPPVEIIKTEVKEVIKNVTTNPICDVSPAEQRMLDHARSGVRTPSGAVDGGLAESGTPPPVRRVSRAREVMAHADAGVKYQQCYAAAKAVEQYLRERAKKR